MPRVNADIKPNRQEPKNKNSRRQEKIPGIAPLEQPFRLYAFEPIAGLSKDQELRRRSALAAQNFPGRKRPRRKVKLVVQKPYGSPRIAFAPTTRQKKDRAKDHKK